MEAVKSRIPEWAKDLRLNLGQIERVDSLTPEQLWGTALAVAVAARNDELLEAVRAQAEPHLGEAARAAARTAAALMGMNNVYYRFLHLVENPGYGQLPARLRMQGLANPGVDKATFELWCLAVSAVNGCGACVASHERVVRQHGLSAQAVQDAVRVAAILHGIAVVLDAEAATAPRTAAT